MRSISRLAATNQGTLAGWFNQICSAGSMFIALPILTRALGAGQLGIWLSFLSVISITGLADFGISFVTARQVAYAMGKGGGRHVKFGDDIDDNLVGWRGVKLALIRARYINIRALTLALIIGALGIGIWGGSLARRGGDYNDILFALILLLATSLIRFTGRPYAAVIEGSGNLHISRYIAGLQQAGTSISGAIIAVATSSLALMALGSLIIALLELYFIRRYVRILLSRGGADSVSEVVKNDVAGIMKAAIPMGVVNLGGYLYSSVQVPLVAAFLSPLIASPFYIMQKLVQFAMQAILQFLFPQLPKFTSAIASADLRKSKSIFLQTILVILVASVIASFALVCFSNWIITHFFSLSPLPYLVVFLIVLDGLITNVAQVPA
jgi:O-antigen/teichoic acid export membrane protein